MMLWKILIPLCVVSQCIDLVKTQPDNNITEVFVDWAMGNDTECSSLQELASDSSPPSPLDPIPCRTINRALGGVGCIDCSHPDPIYNSVLKLSNGIHTLEGCIGITLGENITIEAESIRKTTIRCTTFGRTEVQDFDNIFACGSRGLVFHGINFEGCGPYSSNVFVSRSTDVTFEDCTFRGNTGDVLRLQFVSEINILRTDFINNSNHVPAPQDNENTTISELIRSITTAGAFTYFSRNTSVAIRIENCTFVNNSGSRNEEDTDRPLLLRANGHGGAVLIRLIQVTGARILIINNVFEGNRAEIDGGGIYFALSENTSSNLMCLYNNTFIKNTAYQSSGGAVSWNTFGSSYDNRLIMEECRLINNKGNAGGAVTVSLFDTNVDSFLSPNNAQFIGCLFKGNMAQHEGTAVTLYAVVRVDEFGFPVEFSNCTFLNNIANANIDKSTHSEHLSALLTFRFPVTFKGCNRFIGNFGGGISILSTRIEVEGELLLQSNVASFGGGIDVDDTSLIEINPGVNMTLMNNTGVTSGGGIHLSIPAIRYTTTIFNQLCFLQYKDPGNQDIPPHEWENVSISFIGNKAGMSGAAMFASDMQLCQWNGNDYESRGENSTYIFGDLPDEIAHLSPFHYEDNELLLTTSQINVNLATAPHKLNVTPELQSRVVQPGETIALSILATDQVGNNREAVWSLAAPRQKPDLDGISAGVELYSYQLPSGNILIDDINSCQDNLTGEFDIEFTLPKTLAATTIVSFNLSGCHPGYYMDSQTCVCRCRTTNKDIARCDENKRYLYLDYEVWGGVYYDKDGYRQLDTTYAPSIFLACEQERRLPGCLFKWDDENAQCMEGRTGRLCGICDTGYAVSLDLQRCYISEDKCILGLVFFIILCFLVVILSFLILYFNIGLPNELKGLLFYMQVIGLVHRPFLALNTTANTPVLRGISILVNLLGFSIPIPLCISDKLQAQHIISLLGYISPILVLITVITYVISARFIRTLSNRSSLKGITLLSLFIYKYAADTSFTLCNCSQTQEGLVFTFNGSVNCFSLEFVFFLVIAGLIMILFIVPFPFAVSYICIRRPQRFQHYSDVLTYDLRPKRRWFAGWDVGRRFIFVFVSFISSQPSIKLMLLTLSSVFILVVHLLSKPYASDSVNIIETLVLADLVAVTIVLVNPSNNVPNWLRMFLILVPFVYGIIYISMRVLHIIYIRYHVKNNDDDGDDQSKNFSLESMLQTVTNKMSSIGAFHAIMTRLKLKSADESDSTSATRNENSQSKTSGDGKNQENDGDDLDFSQFRESIFMDMELAT